MITPYGVKLQNGFRFEDNSGTVLAYFGYNEAFIRTFFINDVFREQFSGFFGEKTEYLFLTYLGDKFGLYRSLRGEWRLNR